MISEATEMITIPRAEFDAMQAELRRLRREAAREVALTLVHADPGARPGDEARVFTRDQLVEAWGIRF